jgi:hypothetical protein
LAATLAAMIVLLCSSAPAQALDTVDVSLATATTDLRRLVDAGLITQHGRTRNMNYVASEELRQRARSSD